jgi:hypothetical protein
MINTFRQIVVRGDHVGVPETGAPWTVLWDTTRRTDGQWSTAHAKSEAEALERAAHFVRLGFVVHAIKNPSGTVVMNAEDVAGRFGPTRAPPRPAPEGEIQDEVRREARSDEQSARGILRSFVEDHRATPGRVLATAALQALPAQQGMSPAEFERAVRYAKDHGWLGVADGMLTLTQRGYAEATA